MSDRVSHRDAEKRKGLGNEIGVGRSGLSSLGGQSACDMSRPGQGDPAEATHAPR